MIPYLVYALLWLQSFWWNHEPHDIGQLVASFVPSSDALCYVRSEALAPVASLVASTERLWPQRWLDR